MIRLTQIAIFLAIIWLYFWFLFNDFAMEISQLKTFCVVARKMHFTQASKELNLTQSAVSYQIKSLEEEMGEKLFVRDKRQISLTHKGEIVLDYADRIFRQIKIMKREIEDVKDSLKGTINIVTVTRSLNSPFPKVKLDFKKKYKEINLNFETVEDSETTLHKVKSGISDIGFTTQTDNFGKLLPIPYGEFEMLFLVGKKHPLRKRKRVKLEELRDEEWILFEKGSWLRKKTDNIFQQKEFVPKNIFESNDGVVIRELIKGDGGVGFLPAWGITESLETGNLIPVEIKDLWTKVPINIVISPANQSKLISLFVNYLLEKKVSGVELHKNLEKNGGKKD